MNDDVMDDELDRRALRLHQRKRASVAKTYDCRMAHRAVKRQRTAHLRSIAGALDTTLPLLLAEHPEALGAIPADLAVLAPTPEPRVVRVPPAQPASSP